MASVDKRGDTYRIRVSCGYNSAGKKLVEQAIWKPEPGLTPKQEAKELEQQVYEFEQKVRTGKYLKGEKITFGEYADKWLKDRQADAGTKPRTCTFYSSLLHSRILPAIGHLRLAQIQPAQLKMFMRNLAEPGMKQSIHYRAKPDLRKKAKSSKITAIKIGIADDTWTDALAGRNLSAKTAEAISNKLELEVSELFDSFGSGLVLSPTTQRHYLRCISTILSTAVIDGLILSNPCERVKAPKQVHKDVKHLELDTARTMIEDVKKEADPRIRVVILLLLFTGMRKGELDALEWSDIDLEKGEIHVSRSSQYIYGYKDPDTHSSIVNSSPKTESGVRDISLPSSVVEDLKSYRAFMNEYRLKCGDAWTDTNRVITTWTGEAIHPSTLYHWVKRYLMNHGFPDMTVHGLRHTSISLLLSQGVDLISVSKIAGHASPMTTANIYAHALRKPMKEAADKLQGVLRPQAEAIS